jgi:hypothetical protein
VQAGRGAAIRCIRTGAPAEPGACVTQTLAKRFGQKGISAGVVARFPRMREPFIYFKQDSGNAKTTLWALRAFEAFDPTGF